MQKLIGALIFCFPLAVHALEDSDCPNSIEVSYESLIPVSEQRVERLKRSTNAEAYPTAVRARDAIIATQPEKVQGMAFKYSSMESGSCIFRREGGEGHLQISARGETKTLRVYLPFRGLEMYADYPLTRVNGNGLRLEYHPTSPIQVVAGARAYQVGWTYSISAE